MRVDRSASVVEIAGRVFPAVALICPLSLDPDESEEDRALGAGGADGSVYVPAENGLLFELDNHDRDQSLVFSLRARSCRLYKDIPDDEVWLPWMIGLLGGQLVVHDLRGRDAWDWPGAEDDWVVETIDRVSAKRFAQPEGPHVRLVRLDYFEEAPRATDRAIPGS